jgi:hypothetical protein
MSESKVTVAEWIEALKQHPAESVVQILTKEGGEARYVSPAAWVSEYVPGVVFISPAIEVKS